MDLMEKQIAKEYKANKGMAAVSTILGVTIAVIVIVAVAIPVTTSVVASANLTGTTLTVVNLIPLFFGLAGLMVVAYLVAG